MRDEDIKKLQERMKQFALSVIRLAEMLLASRAARVISDQMVRSGMSAGANYRAACRARSKADFISKMGVVEEELDEVLYWVEISQDAGFLSQRATSGVILEGNELLAIVVSSIRTARHRV